MLALLLERAAEIRVGGYLAQPAVCSKEVKAVRYRVHGLTLVQARLTARGAGLPQKLGVKPPPRAAP